MTLRVEEISALVGTICDLAGGQKRGFALIAARCGVSERIARAWRAGERLAPPRAQFEMARLEREQLEAELAASEAREQRLRQLIRGQGGTDILGESDDALQQARPAVFAHG